MQKVLIAILFLTISFSFAWAGLIGDFYQNERYGCSIGGQGWKPDVSGKKKLISFKNTDDSISEVSLDVVPMTSLDAQSAKDVAVAKIEAYDSWIYVGGRQMEGWEIRNANAADGFLTMYSKNLFSKQEGTMKVLVAERYFVKGGYAYIVTMLTTSKHWYGVKNNLLKIADTFKVK